LEFVSVWLYAALLIIAAVAMIAESVILFIFVILVFTGREFNLMCRERQLFIYILLLALWKNAVCLV
jgi:hypothetical protein